MTELDDAYANRAYIDGADDFPPRWEGEAQAFRDALGDRARVGLPYGEGARHVFDYFVPEGEAQGTLIFVHGGYWRMFDQTSWSHLAAGALARGWAVAMPTYDLCPDVRISDITRQIARAVRAVAEYGAGDFLEIRRTGGKTLLIPFTQEAAPLVDIAAGRIVIDPPEDVEEEPSRP